MSAATSSANTTHRPGPDPPADRLAHPGVNQNRNAPGPWLATLVWPLASTPGTRNGGTTPVRCRARPDHDAHNTPQGGSTHGRPLRPRVQAQSKVSR